MYRPCPGLACLVILSDRKRRSPAPANQRCIQVADSHTTTPTSPTLSPHRTPQTRPTRESASLSAAAEGLLLRHSNDMVAVETATGYPCRRPHASYPVNKLADTARLHVLCIRIVACTSWIHTPQVQLLTCCCTPRLLELLPPNPSSPAVQPVWAPMGHAVLEHMGISAGN